MTLSLFVLTPKGVEVTVDNSLCPGQHLQVFADGIEGKAFSRRFAPKGWTPWNSTLPPIEYVKQVNTIVGILSDYIDDDAIDVAFLLIADRILNALFERSKEPSA